MSLKSSKRKLKRLRRKYREMEAIEKILGGEADPPPITQSFVSLHTSAPTSTIPPGAEVRYTSYARVKRP